RPPLGSRCPRGPAHPDPGALAAAAPHRRASTTRRDTPGHSCHDRRRYRRCPPRTIGPGIGTIAFTMAPIPPPAMPRAVAATSSGMLVAVRTGSGAGAVTGRSSRRRILRWPAAWGRWGIGFPRDRLVEAGRGTVAVD